MIPPAAATASGAAGPGAPSAAVRLPRPDEDRRAPRRRADRVGMPHRSGGARPPAPPGAARTSATASTAVRAPRYAPNSASRPALADHARGALETRIPGADLTRAPAPCEMHLVPTTTRRRSGARAFRAARRRMSAPPSTGVRAWRAFAPKEERIQTTAVPRAARGERRSTSRRLRRIWRGSAQPASRCATRRDGTGPTPSPRPGPAAGGRRPRPG